MWLHVAGRAPALSKSPSLVGVRPTKGGRKTLLCSLVGKPQDQAGPSVGRGMHSLDTWGDVALWALCLATRGTFSALWPSPPEL